MSAILVLHSELLRRVALVLTFGLMVLSVEIADAAPMGTEFTYQGRLIDDNVAADGEYDFQFRLFDSDAGGGQVGGDISIVDVNVIDGYFTVELDFGNVFTGELRWLEIAVRDGDSTGDFTMLSPRQKITAVPYAIKAQGIDSGNALVRGHLEGICVPPPPYPQPEDPLPAYPFEFDISQLGDISTSDVNVIVNGYKFTMPFISEGPLVIRWQVTDSPYDLTLLLEVYDENGNVYDTSDTTNWCDKKLSIDFIASDGSADSSVAFFDGSKIVGGKISGSPPANYSFEFDISQLGDVQASDVMIVASGSKLSQIGVPEKPLMIKWDVNDSPLTVRFRLWDSDGVEFTNIPPIPSAWQNKQIEISFAAFDPNGGGVAADSCDFEDIGGQVSVVLGGMVDASWPSENPAFEFVDSEGRLGEFSTDQAVNEQINVNVIGWKEDGMGNKVGPLVVHPMLESNGTNVKVSVWAYDLDGAACTRADFLGDTLKVRITCSKTAPATNP